MPIETIIIEFQTDVSQLTAGEAKIAESMKKVNVELSKQQQELGREEATMSKLTGSLGKLTGESKKAVQQLLALSGKEVVAGFDKLGLSVDDYVASLKGAEKETKKFGDVTESGRTRLRAMREELLKLAEQGKHNTQRFRELQQAAGRLDDEIRDVQQRIRATGSDTRVFDGLLNAAQGVAGGFAVAQGAAALFGDESAELQETLLRVNSAMAILQGLQQVGQVLTKDSAASLLFLRNAQASNTIATQLATGAESKNIIVKYASLAATKALAVAQALANPVTLAVVAVVVALTAAYKFFTQESKEAEQAQKLLNLQLEAAADIGAGIDEATKQAGEKRKAKLKAQGASERQIRAAEIKTTEELLKDARAREASRQVDADAASARLRVSTNADEVERLKKTAAEFAKIQKNRIDLEHQLELQNLEDTAAINEDQNKLSEKAEADRLKFAEKRKAREAQDRAEFIAAEQERIEQEIAGFQLEQKGLDENNFRWKKLEAAINDAKAALANLTQEGNKAKLALAEAAEENRKLFMQTVESDEKRTDRSQELAEKRISADVKVNQHTQAAASETADFLKEKDKERLEMALQTAGQITAIFAEAFKQQTDNELRQVDDQRKRIADLQEVGAISAKEAERRMKMLDEKERQIKQKGATRDKAIAIFQAIISTAAAIAKALPNIPLSIIAGALGAAQVALIAARPIPKFGKGKKSRYEGLAEVGETGAELIERNGHMQVASKRQITWLSKEDKVYSPSETARMIESMPVMGKAPQTFSKGAKGFSIDYDRMGKSIAKHLPENNISFDKDGFNLSIRKGQETLKYLDKRRRFG